MKENAQIILSEFQKLLISEFVLKALEDLFHISIPHADILQTTSKISSAA